MGDQNGPGNHVTGPGGAHGSFSSNRAPQGQYRTTTPSSGNSNTGGIVAGILVPVILIGISLFVFYIWYRRKYPVRMVIGKDFAKFSNPKYVSKRASTLTLVRNDAESAWDTPDSPNMPKEREHSLSLVKETETETETEQKSTPLQEDSQPDISKNTSNEVVGIEIVPLPRNIARERPKKAKLVKAMELADDLSDSAFEIVTESDLGKRTDSDMSSGNDSTETHTVSLSFKETFDNRHRNTVSIVNDTFDTFVSRRAEHRTNSLPLELKDHADISKSSNLNTLSKSMDSELTQIQKEQVSSDIKFAIENTLKPYESTTEIAHVSCQLDSEPNVETSTNSFDTTIEDRNIAHIAHTETEELPKTASDTAIKTDTKTADEIETGSLEVPLPGLLLSEFGATIQNSINEVDTSEKEQFEIEDKFPLIGSQSKDVFMTDKTNHADNDITKCEIKETFESNTHDMLFSSNDAEKSDNIEHEDSERSITAGMPQSADVNDSFIKIDYPKFETSDIESPSSETTQYRSISSTTSEDLSNVIFSNTPRIISDTFETTHVETIENHNEQQSVPDSSDDAVTFVDQRDEKNDKQVTRTASFTITKDNLFFDAPPTPMIIVRDSFIEEPEPISPLVLDVQENAIGLPFIGENSGSQTSTRSNSFDFNIIPNVTDSEAITEEKEKRENTGYSHNIENNELITLTQKIDVPDAEHHLDIKTHEPYFTKMENMTDEENINSPCLDPSNGDFNTSQLNHDHTNQNTSLDKYVHEEINIAQPEMQNGVENFVSLLKGSSGPTETQAADEKNTETTIDNSSSDVSVPCPALGEEKIVQGENVVETSFSSDGETLNPLKIEINPPEKQQKLLCFDDFDGEKAESLISPTGISTDSSGISWELIGDVSPSSLTDNPIHTGELLNSNFVNEPDGNINIENQQQPFSLLDFETGAVHMPLPVTRHDFTESDTLISNDDRKASDSTSSKEGDTSWEVINDSADISDKHSLSGLDDDASFA